MSLNRQAQPPPHSAESVAKVVHADAIRAAKAGEIGRISFGGDAARPDQLVCGDNLSVARATADGSVNLIYIDPPFGTGQTKRGRSGPRYRDSLSNPDKFVDWLLSRLDESRRALCATGSLFVHLDYRTVHYVKVALDRLFGRSHFVNEIVWCYSVGGKSGKRFGRKHDTILWYAKSRDYAFYPDAVRVARKPKSHMRIELDDSGLPVQVKTDRKTGKVYRYPVHLGKVPEDWWTDIETLNRSDKQRVGWPTQKPERLLERIVGACSQPGDRVVDWFGGSGTTAAVAQRLQRRFVVVDSEPEAIECSAARLSRSGHDLAERGAAPPDIQILRAAEAP